MPLTGTLLKKEGDDYASLEEMHHQHRSSFSEYHLYVYT